ncbi:MAG TPA: S46 family peptidase [Bacteroidales bacterium]|nr:S46 family peptidase [Bacteroidales bacterium]
MRRFLLLLSIALKISTLTAGEGMWIPMLLTSNEAEMKAMGMRISAEDIYSINQGSLKDAIVQFGRGCTASLISSQGLILTNHHCGYGEIQKHSSLQNDYLTDGFWAGSLKEELPNPGLTATLLVKMEDVTDAVLQGITPDMNETRRAEIIRNNSRKLLEEARKASNLDISIRPFYHGNQYIMMYNMVFRDVRLVGAPPSNIGKFGGDTDNWMWPRHTGDFSLFRIYVNAKGEPAEYHPDNIPYQPVKWLPISLKGVEEGDFTFVFGYPGRTSQYLPAAAVMLITEVSNPQRVMLRGTRLEIFKHYSQNDPLVRIQYAVKDARVANAWKKMAGETKGIRRLNGIERKQDLEKHFLEWASATPELQALYGGIVDAFNQHYRQLEPLTLASDYLSEAGMGIEILQFAARFIPLAEEAGKAKPDTARIAALKKTLVAAANDFFKDYHQPIDREVATALLSYYLKNQPADFRPDFLGQINSRFKGNLDDYVKHLFGRSIFASQSQTTQWISNFGPKSLKKLEKDPAFQAASSMRKFNNQQIEPAMRPLQQANDSLMRLFISGLMKMQSDRRFYPDANSTLRVTYGKVEGYQPADAITYHYFTTLEGILEKENPDIEDYFVDPRLKTLHQNSDFGPYAAPDGRMRVAFTASNHTTGGNSGSPVLDANGYLVGLNFDRCWEGTMSDLMYDPAMSRNISADIRYVLFIVDKFAGATHLINEMTLLR